MRIAKYVRKPIQIQDNVDINMNTNPSCTMYKGKKAK